MNNIRILVWKELLQVFRNKAMLPLLTVIPIVQLILLSFAASNEVKNINLAVYDADQSGYSHRLMNKFTASGYFVLKGYPESNEQAAQLLDRDEADLVLCFPKGFENDILKDRHAKVQILANAINGTKGGLANGYANAIIAGFGKEIQGELSAEWALARRTNAENPSAGRNNNGKSGTTDLSADKAVAMIPPVPASIRVLPQVWYNPTLDYKAFMVPGILGVLVTILTLILSAMNVVREREIGTIEQLNVSPIKKYQFILGKLLPFLFIGWMDLALGLAVGKLLFHIPLEGSLVLIFAFCTVNLIVVLGIGLLISTLVETQQQAMFVAWFFMMIFILMSGLFTPIESMPGWAQKLTIPNPIAHFVAVMRQVMLKGSGWRDVAWHFEVMGALAVVFGTMAVLAYRKRG
ncbi:MAG TPA: ABC transporter permease [Flavilitoribacter sp.]|nr:ABC transporter permease [Flavilitoribacter sp.]HMQ86103.1 ABC transporter permease [Flavilitoribacter sp.]